MVRTMAEGIIGTSPEGTAELSPGRSPGLGVKERFSPGGTAVSFSRMVSLPISSRPYGTGS